MSGAEDCKSGVDEFESIARLLRPLTQGAPEALGLMDDAAVVLQRPGFDLVISKDAMVEGVHFLAEDPMDLVARKLLRVNLSDLAAKDAEPYAYLLAAAWPARCGWPEREAFARGLAQDQQAFGVTLIGGDTSSTPGPLALSLTILGWTPAGRLVKRSGARPGDRVLVSGTIGDGALGLQAAQGRLVGIGEGETAWLADRYRLPQPRLQLAGLLREHASAAADVSDGLVADAGHIAEASGVAITLDLEHVPLSEPARAWLSRQEDRAAALVRLATGGDDYEVVMTAPPGAVTSLVDGARRAGLALTDVGTVTRGESVSVLLEGQPLTIERRGWTHG
jgi:thiamine-monophosphate kinase